MSDNKVIKAPVEKEVDAGNDNQGKVNSINLLELSVGTLGGPIAAQAYRHREAIGAALGAGVKVTIGLGALAADAMRREAGLPTQHMGEGLGTGLSSMLGGVAAMNYTEAAKAAAGKGAVGTGIKMGLDAAKGATPVILGPGATIIDAGIEHMKKNPQRAIPEIIISPGAFIFDSLWNKK